MKSASFFRIRFIPTYLLAIFLGITFLIPAANKFDTTPQILLVLAFSAIVLFISFLAFFYKEKSLFHEDRLFRFVDGSLKIALFAYLMWVVFSFFHSQTATFGFTEVFMALSGGLLFFSLRSRFLSSSLIYALLNFLLLVTCFLGYIFYFTSHHNRAFGLFFNPAFKTDAWPNAFALFILLLWPFLFALWWKAKRWIWLKTLALSLVFASFILSFSRAGLLVFIFQLSLFLIVGLYFFLRKKEPIFQRRKILMIFGCVIMTAFLVMAAQFGRQMIFEKTTLSFSDKAQFKNGEEMTSIRERIDFMKGGIELAFRQPLFGFGPMSFSYVYRSIQTDWLAIADHPHNIFIKIAVENGIPALLFFILFILFLFIKIFLYAKKLSPPNRFLLLIGLVALLGGLSHNLVDYNFNFVTNFVIFWLILVFLDRLPLIDHEAGRKENAMVWPDSVVRGALFLMVLFFFSFQTFFTGISFLAKRGFLENEKIQSYLAVHMFYPRYFLLDQAAEALKAKNTHVAEQYYLLHIKKNKWDAMAYHQIGNFYVSQGRFDDALSYSQKALELDPKNVWAYYWQYLQLLQKKRESETFLALSAKLVQEFEQYTPKVETNIHFTAQNSNSKDALEVLRLLMKNDKANRLLFTSYFDRITAARNRYVLP